MTVSPLLMSVPLIDCLPPAEKPKIQINTVAINKNATSRDRPLTFVFFIFTSLRFYKRQKRYKTIFCFFIVNKN
jgi:hypothetical protein